LNLRKAKGPANNEHESGEPSQSAERLQSPLKGENARGHPKGNDIGKGIVFDPKLGGRVGESRNSPVQPVENRRNNDGHCGSLESSINGRHNSKKTAEKACRGEKIGQDVDPPPSPALLSFLLIFFTKDTLSRFPLP
jgi:hypothetical protein